MSEKKLKKSKLKTKADKLVSLYVRKQGFCDMCGKTENLQCAHVITRSNLTLRFDLFNLMCLCSGCHLRWHREPLWASKWFETKYPERYAYLMEKRTVITKNLDYDEILDKYK